MSDDHPGAPIRVTTDRSRRNLAKLEHALSDRVFNSFPSGLSLAVVDTEGTVFSAYGGWACQVGSRRPITESTSYDLASLTKVVCSVSLTTVFAGRHMLALEDPVQGWLPRFAQEDTTILHLITHTSGLTDQFFFERMTGRHAIEEALFESTKSSLPKGEVLYADINFILLGWLLEACGGDSLDELFARHIATPLSMSRTGFRPPAEEETAATELDGDQRLSPVLVWGEVHDGNAHALGGVSGHAGLFAPLADLVTFTRHLLVPDGRILNTADIDLIAARRAGQQPDIRALGWRLAPQGWGNWPENTLWHTGFTGTSLLVSRSLGIAVVLLTNAVHPYRRIDEQAEMRAVLHQLVSEAFT